MKQRKGDWIETFTGGQFWPLDPRPEEVDIIDIAHSLSMQCRFNGHTRVFYSVAEHSVIVAKELEAAGYNALIQFYGLLHDAAEAYLCDLPRPIKNQISEYRTMEKTIQEAVWKAFGVPQPSPGQSELIKQMDTALLGFEGKMLMRNVAGWTNSFYPFRPKTLTALGLAHSVAKQQFLSLFADLTRRWGSGYSSAKL